MPRRLIALACTGLLAFAAQAAPSSLVVCTEASPEGFDIAQYTAATSADASAETLFDRLLRFAPGSAELLPGLAERWEISADGREYTFQLRRGVRFQRTPWFVPSRELNADDVIWSFRRQINPRHPWHRLAPHGFPYAESMALGELIERIERLDDHRVRFVLRHPEAPFLADLAMSFASIYPAEYADQLLAAGTPEKLNSQPVGSGPFVFERYEKDVQVRFRRHPEHWAGPPATERLIFAITPEPNVRVQKLKAGDCQIALAPRPVDIPSLRKDRRLRVLEGEPLLTAYVGINTRHPPLDDVRVRQALNLAFDKSAYLRAQYGEGGAIPAVAPYPPSLWGSAPDLAGWPYDPDRARRLLAEAGHAAGFRLDIWTRPGGGPSNPNPGIGAQMLQADLAAISIEARIRVLEWGELIRRAKRGEHDLIFMGWAGDNGDPDNFLTPNLSCAAAASGENQAGWCNRAFDALLREARRNPDRQQRAALYRQALHLFHQEAPWIPLAHPREFAAVRRDIEGFVVSPLGTNNFAGVRRTPPP